MAEAKFVKAWVGLVNGTPRRINAGEKRDLADDLVAKLQKQGIVEKRESAPVKAEEPAGRKRAKPAAVVAEEIKAVESDDKPQDDGGAE